MQRYLAVSRVITDFATSLAQKVTQRRPVRKSGLDRVQAKCGLRVRRRPRSRRPAVTGIGVVLPAGLGLRLKG